MHCKRQSPSFSRSANSFVKGNQNEKHENGRTWSFLLEKRNSESWRVLFSKHAKFQLQNSLPSSSISGWVEERRISSERTVSDFTFYSLIYIMENKYVDWGEEERRKKCICSVHIFVTSIVKTLRLSSERLKNWMMLKWNTENCFTLPEKKFFAWWSHWLF